MQSNLRYLRDFKRYYCVMGAMKEESLFLSRRDLFSCLGRFNFSSVSSTQSHFLIPTWFTVYSFVIFVSFLVFFLPVSSISKNGNRPYRYCKIRIGTSGSIHTQCECAHKVQYAVLCSLLSDRSLYLKHWKCDLFKFAGFPKGNHRHIRTKRRSGYESVPDSLNINIKFNNKVTCVLCCARSPCYSLIVKLYIYFF